MENEIFIKLVAELRSAQKAYFKSRDKFYLIESKRIEKEVDSYIFSFNLGQENLKQKQLDIGCLFDYDHPAH